LTLVQVAAGDAAAALARGDVDAAVARLPVDKTHLSAIALYEELPVVVFARDDVLAASQDDETLAVADLGGHIVYLPADDVLARGGGALPALDVHSERPRTTKEAIAWVASAGVGAAGAVTIVPMSLARLHHRKDVTYRVLDGGPVSAVGLVWVSDRTTDLVEQLIGIVRGRTVNSSRGKPPGVSIARPAGATQPPDVRGRAGRSSRGNDSRSGSSRR
jgi:sulfur transfer complex TusBCD TusB component (DsrH family)